MLGTVAVDFTAAFVTLLQMVGTSLSVANSLSRISIARITWCLVDMTPVALWPSVTLRDCDCVSLIVCNWLCVKGRATECLPLTMCERACHWTCTIDCVSASVSLCVWLWLCVIAECVPLTMCQRTCYCVCDCVSLLTVCQRGSCEIGVSEESHRRW